MWGVITQVSAPKSSTAWTTDLKKNPNIRGAAPSLMRTCVSLRHTARALASFTTTAGQSSSASEITRPNYLKEVTISRELPYALKSLELTALSSYASRRCLFFSAPFLHWALHRCIPFRARYVTSMSHRGHRGRGGGVPSAKINTVSRT